MGFDVPHEEKKNENNIFESTCVCCDGICAHFRFAGKIAKKK